MKRVIIMLAVAMAWGDQAMAVEPLALVKARREFHALSHLTEADRVRYLTKLVRLRESFTRAEAKAMFAIDAEVSKHPMPGPVDAQRLVGMWSSPRHTYLYRKDGTWFMLPRERPRDATDGRWRIAGNKFFLSYQNEPKDNYAHEKIFLLTKSDFVWGREPFYESRGSVSPYHP